MDKLSITQNDYNKMLLMTNFLSEFKHKIGEMNNIEDIIFISEKEGYIITFTYDNTSSKIVLSVNSGVITTKLKVKYIVGNEKVKDFVSKNNDENREIINKIFAYNTPK